MSMAIQSWDAGGNRTSSTISGSYGDGPKVAILFVGVSLLLGIASRELLYGTKVPYIVALLLLRIGLGSLEYGTKHGLGKLGANIHVWAKINPNLILFVFLLAFFSLRAPLPWKFTKSRDLWKSLLLGSLLSAIDPVIVVALLKELGASKKLSTTIEGECLMNDGVGLGAVALGLTFRLVSVLWLGVIFNDTVIEITLTLTISYVAYKFLDMDVGSLGLWSIIHQRQDYLGGLNIESGGVKLLGVECFISFSGILCNNVHLGHRGELSQLQTSHEEDSVKERDWVFLRHGAWLSSALSLLQAGWSSRLVAKTFGILFKDVGLDKSKQEELLEKLQASSKHMESVLETMTKHMERLLKEMNSREEINLDVQEDLITNVVDIVEHLRMDPVKVDVLKKKEESRIQHKERKQKCKPKCLRNKIHVEEALTRVEPSLKQVPPIEDQLQREKSYVQMAKKKRLLKSWGLPRDKGRNENPIAKKALGHTFSYLSKAIVREGIQAPSLLCSFLVL
eukprot:Gb_09339 [translate_table: standard]